MQNNHPHTRGAHAARRVATACALLAALSGCGALLPTPAPPPAYFSLQPASNLTPPLSLAKNEAGPAGTPTVLVQLPRAGAGLDSTRILYSRQGPQWQYFARSEWVDSPARMLTPLIVQALQRAQSFGAVVQAPSAALGELRLETQVLALQQDFGAPPSRVRFVISAQLIDDTRHRVLATRYFNTSAAAATEDAAGGVLKALNSLRKPSCSITRVSGGNSQSLNCTSCRFSPPMVW